MSMEYGYVANPDMQDDGNIRESGMVHVVEGLELVYRCQ